MESFQILIGALVSLLAASIIIILWFASRNKKLLDNHENRLSNVSLSLEESVGRLENSIIRIEANVNANLAICKERHILLNENIKCNEERISNSIKKIHEIEISLVRINSLKNQKL